MAEANLESTSQSEAFGSPEIGELAGFDGTLLRVRRWTPREPRGTVVIVHGFAEHGGRYGVLVQALLEAGLAVLAYDARGHGESAGMRVGVRRFDEYTRDLRQVLDAAQAKQSGPLFLFGHSMGGLVCLKLLIDAPGIVDGTILSNPALAQAVRVPWWKAKLATIASQLVPDLALPSELDPSSMSRDPEAVRSYDSDPLNSKVARSRWFTEFVGAQAEVQQRAETLAEAAVLWLVGTGDQVIDATVTLSVVERIAGSQATLKTYTGYYHELIHEPQADRQRVLADVTAWLEARLTA